MSPLPGLFRESEANVNQKPITVRELYKCLGRLLREEECPADTPILIGDIGKPDESLRFAKFIRHGIAITSLELLSDEQDIDSTATGPV